MPKISRILLVGIFFACVINGSSSLDINHKSPVFNDMIDPKADQALANSPLKRFRVDKKMTVFYSESSNTPCYNYAVAELIRLLTRINVSVHKVGMPDQAGCFSIELSRSGTISGAEKSFPPGLKSDAYRFIIAEKHMTLTAATPKGILNGVYDFAEQLGYLFLFPGLDGEWQPTKSRVQSLAIADTIIEPRFPFRGVFWQGLNENDFSNEEWLRFYAMLRFNALRHEIKDLALAAELGFRLEVGEHEFSRLMPREYFDKNPEWFRMSLPEDFSGQRTKDANLCITNQQARKVIKQNFRVRLKELTGAHAVHAWPDDLPGGGWCLCPSCRSFAPCDQAMMAMRCLAEVVAEDKLSVRIPMLAYHDTMFPGAQIDVAKECFLLYAPRERCYGHALDDSSCQRNAFYFEALKAWTKKFNGIDDAHTFEYYFDQLLFRGLYPFLPGIIIKDLSVYQKYGIECALSLQVAGPAIAPEYNMLVFAKAQWDTNLTQESFIERLSARLCPEHPQPWQDFFNRLSLNFTNAMRMCGYNPQIYMDYRWLPESNLPFSREMALVYKDTFISLNAMADQLAASIDSSWPRRLQVLADKEIRRLRFEAAELQVMFFQQQAMNHLAGFSNTRDENERAAGILNLENTIAAQRQAVQKAKEARLPEKSWYYGNINSWLSREFKKKIDNYRVQN